MVRVTVVFQCSSFDFHPPAELDRDEAHVEVERFPDSPRRG